MLTKCLLYHTNIYATFQRLQDLSTVPSLVSNHSFLSYLSHGRRPCSTIGYLFPTQILETSQIKSVFSETLPKHILVGQ